MLAALDTVIDPELDQPITELRFVEEVTVDGDDVLVVLRLPTYWCSPNFTFLMVADAHDAVRSVEGVGSATIRLDDHFASDEINAGVAGGKGFTGSFPGLAEAELEDLRTTFRRKAHAAAQEVVAAGSASRATPRSAAGSSRSATDCPTTPRKETSSDLHRRPLPGEAGALGRLAADRRRVHGRCRPTWCARPASSTCRTCRARTGTCWASWRSSRRSVSGSCVITGKRGQARASAGKRPR